MPFQIQVDAQIIRVILTGYVTKAEMLELAEETARLDVRLGETLDRLIDLSAIEQSESDNATISHLAQLGQMRIYAKKFKAAIVAPNPLDYGCSRMYQTLAENPQVERQIFKTLGEAENWLSSTPSTH